MQPLGVNEHKQIVKLIEAEGAMMRSFVNRPGVCLGERVVFQPNPRTAQLAIVRKKYRTCAAVEVKHPRSSGGHSCTLVVKYTFLRRFPPPLTQSELEDLAVQYGCLWGAKQLRYEMRRVRNALPEGHGAKKRPEGIREYIRRVNAAVDDDEEEEESEEEEAEEEGPQGL